MCPEKSSALLEEAVDNFVALFFYHACMFARIPVHLYHRYSFSLRDTLFHYHAW